MTFKTSLSIFLIYSLLLLLFLPTQNFAQIRNNTTENIVTIDNKIPVKEKKVENNLSIVPAKNQSELIENRSINSLKLKKSFSNFKQESKIEKPNYKTNAKNFKNTTYKLSDDDDNKKKKGKWGEKTKIVVMVVVIFGVIAILAATTNVPECDSTACDPFDEDCICG